MKLLVGFLALTLSAGSAPAAIFSTFFGQDALAGPTDPRPNSDLAALQFDTAASFLGPVSVLNFESVAIQTIDATGITVAPGITLAMTNADITSPTQGINNDNTTLPLTLGYNTTAGGSRYARMVPVVDQITYDSIFSFADPIQAFGTYISGVDTFSGAVTVLFNDGSNQQFQFNGQFNGGIQFFGITDPGASISGVTISMMNQLATPRDIYTLDDFRTVLTTPAAVPIPASAYMGGALIAAMVVRRWRRGTRDA